jgi:hypothetical protein
MKRLKELSFLKWKVSKAIGRGGHNIKLAGLTGYELTLFVKVMLLVLLQMKMMLN